MVSTDAPHVMSVREYYYMGIITWVLLHGFPSVRLLKVL